MADRPQGASEHTTGGSSEAVEAPSTGRAKVVRATLWTVMGHGGAQFVRLVRNLILTRLLAPDLFGLMLIANTVRVGLEMFSDTGVGVAIVRDKRGTDPEFVNTAWTIQVIRGFVLWACCCLLAMPASVYYEAPQLKWILPAVGLIAIFRGCISTSIYTAKRNLSLGRLTSLEFSAEVVALCITVAWAVISPSIWALVVGAVMTAVVLCTGSHTLLPGIRARFCWNKEAFRELFRFGKWIFLSSAVHFLARQGDRLVLAKLLPLDFLGVYFIAVALADAMETGGFKLSGHVLYPVLADVERQDPSGLSQAYYRARRWLDVLLIGGGLVIMAGPAIITVLYPAKFAGAGWVLQLLAIKVCTCCISMPAENCLVARGYPAYGLWRRIGLTVAVFAGVPLGWHLNGTVGAVWAVALAELPGLVILSIGLMRHGIFRIAYELRGVAYLAVGMIVGALANWLAPWQ